MESKPAGCGLTLAYLSAWLVSSIVLVLDVVFFRAALLHVLQWLAAHATSTASANSSFGMALEFADQAMSFILGCAGVALAVAFEYYYRRGAENGSLIRRVSRVIGIQLAVGVVAWIIQLFVR
jgi:hypothetical protein